MATEKKFVTACKEFFGMRDGQTAIDFLKETKALTNADRKEIADGMMKLHPDWIIPDVEKIEPAAVPA